jgi:hypothetical protein
MDFAIQYKHLGDLCIFRGKPGGIETFEVGTHDVVDPLEEMVFGPRPEGEIPIRTGPWVKSLPGDDTLKFRLSAPDAITYPANALLFAAHNNLPLINEVQGMPVPGMPADARGNAKLLATILAIESVSFVLPRVKPLVPEVLKDCREELAPQVRPFRLAMLKLAKELNASIQTDATLAEVQK